MRTFDPPFFPEITGDLTLEEAVFVFVETRRIPPKPGHYSNRYVNARTQRSYRGDGKALILFFGQKRLDQIKPDDLREYQRIRSNREGPFAGRRAGNSKNKGTVSALVVNRELSVLIRLLKLAGCWTHSFEVRYEPLLQGFSEIPRALTPEEQDHWLQTCRMDRRWEIVYFYSLLAFDTSMSTNELRWLRLGDVNLTSEVITIQPQGAKNCYRLRTISLSTAEGKWAAEQLLQRARSLGATSPIHFLFPSRIARGKFNPEFPMSETGIRKQWEEVRIASGLKWFRQYDLRHTAITRQAENGINLAVIQKRAGHNGRRMTEHYTHISEQAERRETARAYKRTGASPAPPGVGYHPKSQAGSTSRACGTKSGRTSSSAASILVATSYAYDRLLYHQQHLVGPSRLRSPSFLNGHGWEDHHAAILDEPSRRRILVEKRSASAFIAHKWR